MLCGPSGSGKTTLLRHLKRELTPVGSSRGTLTYKGQPLSGLPAAVAAGEIGMVFQNPDAQIVMDTVWHEPGLLHGEPGATACCHADPAGGDLRLVRAGAAALPSGT